MIEVKNLTKRYGNHTAVDDISFTIQNGAVYGFLGPNGAGKSTTMNIITGCLGATSGEVLIDGHNITDEPMKAKKLVGYLPEQPPLYTDMTADEYLRFVAEAKGIPLDERKAKIRSVKERTGISDVSDRLLRNLSKGYRQRVGIAQAILGDPEIVILDEPTVGLDPKQIIEIRELIRDLGKTHTLILSSHILSEVQAVCDSLMIISKGKLVASDTAENLTKLFQGAATLYMQVKGETEAVSKALEGIDGIESFEKCEDGGYSVSMKAGQDVREEIFYALSGARLPILEMTCKRASLEDVFLELTETDQKEAEQ